MHKPNGTLIIVFVWGMNYGLWVVPFFTLYRPLLNYRHQNSLLFFYQFDILHKRHFKQEIVLK